MKEALQNMDYRLVVKALSIFRFVFLAVMGVSTLILHSFYSDPASPIALQLFALGSIFSLTSWALLKSLSEKYIVALAWAQIFWDLAATSYLIYQTGGLYSAYSLLFTVYILLGAVLLRARGAIVTALISDILLLFIAVSTKGWKVVSDAEVLSRVLFELSLVAFFGGALAYLAKHRERLSSSLQKTQADLKGLSALHSTIVEHIPSGIIYLDSDYQFIRFVNRAGVKIFGSNLTGLRIHETPLSVLDLSRRDQSELRHEVQLRFKDQDRVLGYHMSPLPEGGLLIVFQDLTDIRDLESKMRVREKLASVGQLAAGIAHEIRNPLASLSGSIQLMKGDVSPNSETEKLMTIVLRETDRLDSLIRNFLIYAKPSELRLEEVNLRSLLSEIIDLLKNHRGRDLASVRWKLRVSSDLSLRADPQQLRQILWNLLLNAVDAVAARGGDIEVSAEELMKDSETILKIFIRDSGMGISQSIQEKIFDPFFTTKSEGTGLGLSLVYQMVKAHSGLIGLQSQEGVGTTFWLEFWKKGPRNMQIEAA